MPIHNRDDIFYRQLASVPTPRVLVGVTVSCHVLRALNRPTWSDITLPHMSAPLGSASESRTPAYPPAPKLASARWPGTPLAPGPDWTRIPNRARTDHSPLERDPTVNKLWCLRAGAGGLQLTTVDRQPGPRIKLETKQLGPPASPGPHSNGTRRVTSDYDLVGTW